jgi:hypothetical protein
LIIGTHSLLQEKVELKKIALIIDSMKPGMNVTLDISPLMDDAKKNRYSEQKVLVYLEGDYVVVKLSYTGLQKFRHFSNLIPQFYFNTESKTMTIST